MVVETLKDVKRVISTGIWEDDLVLNDFSPEDKYFFLYILTNQYTTQLGIYHFPIKKVALEMGYSEDAIKVLLDSSKVYQYGCGLCLGCFFHCLPSWITFSFSL